MVTRLEARLRGPVGLLQLASKAVLLRSASVPVISFPVSAQGSCPVLDCCVGHGELQLP